MPELTDHDDATWELNPAERELWRGVFATSWHQPTARQGLGFITDEERALFAARHADRAVRALHKLVRVSPTTELMVQVMAKYQ